MTVIKIAILLTPSSVYLTNTGYVNIDYFKAFRLKLETADSTDTCCPSTQYLIQNLHFKEEFWEKETFPNRDLV